MNINDSYKYIKRNNLQMYLLKDKNLPLIYDAIVVDICKKYYSFTADMINVKNIIL